MLGLGPGGVPLRTDDLFCFVTADCTQVLSLGSFSSDISFFTDSRMTPKSEMCSFILADANYGPAKIIIRKTTVAVADIKCDMILGLDFIRASHLTIRYCKERIRFGVISLNSPRDGIPPSWQHLPSECKVDENFDLLTVNVKVAPFEDEHNLCPLFTLQDVPAVIDTGSLFTVIDREFAEDVCFACPDRILPYGKGNNMTTVNGGSLKMYGVLPLYFYVPTCSKNWPELVINGSNPKPDFVQVGVHVVVLERFHLKLLLGQTFLQSGSFFLHPGSGTLGPTFSKYPPLELFEAAVLRHPSFLCLPTHPASRALLPGRMTLLPPKQIRADEQEERLADDGESGCGETNVTSSGEPDQVCPVPDSN